MDAADKLYRKSEDKGKCTVSATTHAWCTLIPRSHIVFVSWECLLSGILSANDSFFQSRVCHVCLAGAWCKIQQTKIPEITDSATLFVVTLKYNKGLIRERGLHERCTRCLSVHPSESPSVSPLTVNIDLGCTRCLPVCLPTHLSFRQ